ncbi:MAG TPA: MerR family transcriptional regulator [Solirubrobacteraceae bacterium]|nr:MerR family transcriptional regulator [Solirubrobacteraceae bacterium]
MSTLEQRREAPMRIGEVAELTGVTPRTIRYYEELGLLGALEERVQGKHRCYSEADLERIREIVRLRDLLGLSLEQLSQLLEAETARAEIRRELGDTEDNDRRRELLTQAAGHIETQLGLVQGRLEELRALEATLLGKRERVAVKLAELAAADA